MNQLTHHASRRRSPVRALRALVPRRPLRYQEALRIAELQANHLRHLLGIMSPELPDDAIAGLPRVTITTEPDLPVSGIAQWHNGHWLIAINDSEPWNRARFTTCHELFHIINHTTREFVHPDDGSLLSPTTRAERLADYFAGCLLMPKQHIKRLVGEGQKPEQLADAFGVSLRAVTVRLAQLGITQLPRCVQPVNRVERVTKPYTRALPRDRKVVA